MRRFQGVAASLFACACAAGCGEVHTLSDAPPGDGNAAADANTTQDAAVAVTVTTYSRSDGSAANHTRVPNVPIYVVQPGGALGPVTQTDGTGTVSILGVEAGASITAVYTLAGGGFKIVTTLGVKPGDNLIYGDLYRTSHSSITPVTMTAAFPAVTGATQFTVQHPCGTDSGGASPVTVNIGCDATQGDFYLRALDGSGTVLATATLHGAAYGAGQTVTLPAWTDVAQPILGLSASGLSAEVLNVNFQAASVVDGIDNNQAPIQFFLVPSNATVSTTLAVPTGGDRLFAVDEVHNVNTTASWGNKEQFLRLATDVRMATFTEPGLPWFGSLTWDAANQKVSWTTQGSGGYDGMLLEVQWSAGASVPVNYDWDIIAPPGLTQFSWANPPAQLAPYVPAVTDTPSTNSSTTALIDLSSATSYDQLRQQPEWFLSNPGAATEDGELPTGSNIALSPGGEGYLAY
jgi:hypothetical protein